MASTPRRAAGGVAALVACVLLTAGCSTASQGAPRPEAGETVDSPSPAVTATREVAPSPSPSPAAARIPDSTSRITPTTAEPGATGAPGARPPVVGDGRPRTAFLSIPALGLRDLRVVPYRGWTDDAPGTAIQNAGDGASPFGPRGGTGPGGIGNYQVTGHRLSSTMPFRYLPSLAHGAEVHVVAGSSRYVYRIVATRRTSFRDPASLREQRAAVPGRPGVTPRRAMITLSTCATIEDHAAGNFWSDEHGNPEHRIDKIGVLVEVERRAG